MDKMNEERMVYLKDLVFAALYRYKSILTAALVFALMLGGFMGLRSWKQASGAGQTFEQAMEAYNEEKASLGEELQELQQELKLQKEYLKTSVLQQLRAYDYYVAEINLYVETNDRSLQADQNQLPSRTDDVIAAYKALFTVDEVLRALAESLQTEPRYVKELLQTERTANSSLTVRVMCPDETQAIAVKKLLEQKLAALQTQVEAAVCVHRISIVAATVQRGTDASVAERQVQAQNRVQELENAESAAQENLDALLVPEPASAQRTRVVKKTVIFGVIGAVLGVFLVAMIAWIKHIAGARIYSARTLIGYTGIGIVGCLNDKPMKKGLINCLCRLEGRETKDAAAQAAVLAVNIGNRLGDAKKLLLTGTATAAQRKLLAEALQAELPQVQVMDLGCILEDAQAMRGLSESDAVVLVEQCHKSCYADALRQATLVKDCGKAFLGCVLLGG